MRGLDFLGSVAPTQSSRNRAAASGQRALAVSQRIAKRAPQLAASIAKAGQKALAAGGKPVAAATVSAPPSPGIATAKPSAPTQESARPRPVTHRAAPQPQRRTPPPMARRVVPPKKGAHIGDDGEDGQVVDAYAQLADTAAAIGDFMAELQGLVEGLPPNSQLAQQGLGVISQLQNWFGNPLDAALQGDQQAVAKAPAIADVLQAILANRDDSNRPWPWNWVAAATAYLQVHPPVAQADSGTAPAGTTAQPQPGSPPVGTVARVNVLPRSAAVAVGVAQTFSAQVLDANGQAISPKNPVTWAVSGAPAAPAMPSAYPATGPSIDQGGSFIAQAPGNYAITATADGVTGSALAIVQASMQAPGAMPSASGGGYGSGGGYSGGGGGDYGGGGYGGGDYADQGGAYPDDGGGYADQGAEQGEDGGQGQGDQEQYADDGGGQANEGQSQFEETLSYLGGGRGGGHGHGGHGHHHHGGGGRGRRRGDGAWGGPWPWGYDGIEIEDAVDTDELAEAVARKLKAHVVVGLDFLGKSELPTTKEQIIAARKLPVSELRRMALEQIGLAGKMLSKASGVAWSDPTNWTPYTAMVAKMADYLRWQPSAKLIDDAKAAYDRGQNVEEPLDPTEHYLTAWTTGRLAVDAIAKEADLGKTSFLVESQGAAQDAAAAIEKAAASTGSFLQNNWPWLAGGAVALVVLPAVVPPLVGALAVARR